MSPPRDIAGFKHLYKNYYSGMLAFTASILHDEEEAKDIVQEVFYYLWKNADQIHIETNIKDYLFTAAKNKALNRIRHYRIRDSHNDQIREAYLMAGELEPEIDEGRLKQVVQCIDDLPPQMKKVVLLRTSSGKKYYEIAKEMGLSINTVKTHLKRAMDSLRNSLL